MLQALNFDVDGTLADTESMYRAAFNAAFAETGLDWRWDEPLEQTIPGAKQPWVDLAALARWHESALSGAN